MSSIVVFIVLECMWQLNFGSRNVKNKDCLVGIVLWFDLGNFSLCSVAGVDHTNQTFMISVCVPV